MQDFVTFIGDMLSEVSTFLMSEPIIYFVGCALLLFVVRIFLTLTKGGCT